MEAVLTKRKAAYTLMHIKFQEGIKRLAEVKTSRDPWNEEERKQWALRLFWLLPVS
jgi:hypothetical protein